MIWEMLYCVLFFIMPIIGMFVAISIRNLKCKNVAQIDESEVASVIEEKVINDIIYENIAVIMRKLIQRSNNYYGKMRPRKEVIQGIVIDLEDYRKRKRKQKGGAYARAGPYNTS
ncbi:hypothetical protein [Cellulosilyticum ruminicola]|uniref:hypothetical protein n=1 Tax=Cellulosilyticum ruminicola TaxID=425254 RepID=UPI0006D22E12|nr:hypothetical protein [Cellulosilyticum ruminicola]